MLQFSLLFVKHLHLLVVCSDATIFLSLSVLQVFPDSVSLRLLVIGEWRHLDAVQD